MTEENKGIRFLNIRTKSPSPRRGVGVRLNPNLYRFVANLYYHYVISMLTDAYCCRVKGCLCFTKFCA